MLVNGEPEQRRGRQLRPGDEVADRRRAAAAGRRVDAAAVGRDRGADRLRRARRRHRATRRPRCASAASSSALGADDRGDLDVRDPRRRARPGRPAWSASPACSPRRRRCARPSREAVAARRAPAAARRLLRARARARSPGCATRVGALGVAYVDGHVDVYDGRSSPTGEAADMPMGVAFGLGPAAVGRGGRRPERRAGATSSCSARAIPRRRRTSRELLAGRLAALERARPGRAAREGPADGGRPAAARLSGARSGSTSTSTCSTSARCPRPTT